jgi:hypothetical protein
LKRRRPALAAVVALLLLLAHPVQAGMADRVGATFGLMTSDFARAFQPIEAVVVSVEGQEIFLDVNEGNGAVLGQEYAIFRKGEPFAHPITGKLLGRYEEILGHAQIIRVYPRFSAARYLPVASDAPRPRTADGARITRARIRVAVTPVMDMTGSQADVRRVPFLIAAGLEQTRRFQVVDPLRVSDMFATGGVRVEDVLARPERAMRSARTLELTGWVVPMLLERRGTTYLDVTYISAITGTALFSRRLPLITSSGGEDQRFPWEPRPED